jgi:WD40 repeat protein/tetratricopeptide (TPR) repeat protein
MGVVYKAVQVGLGRTVALKMLLAGAHADVAQLARFRTEGEAIGRLRHPNVVQVYDTGTSDGLPYFALEYVEHGSLEGYLHGTPQPPGEAAVFLEVLAWATAAAHREGIIHRDLKPGNILMARDPNRELRPGLAGFVPRITDFGLAKWAEQCQGLTRTGTLAGTPAYMAPEQAAGDQKAIGPAADVYALGAVLYELLTGRPPFQGSTSLDTLDLVRYAEPVPPGQLVGRLPRDLETICLRCLEKEPARRYISAAALADDLGRFGRGEPIIARPVGATGRVWKWARRRPSLAILLGLTAAALVGGTGVSAYFAVEAKQRARDAERAGEEKQRALEAAQEARRQSDLRAAESRFRVALDQCEAGAVDRGMFTMLEAWRTAPKDAAAFRRGVRTNLAAWSRQLPILEHVLQHPQHKYVLTRFVEDGKVLITWDIPFGRHVAAWDPATGEPIGPPLVAPAGEEVVDMSPDGKLVSTQTEVDGKGRFRERSTGRLIGSEFAHRPPGVTSVHTIPLFCGTGDLVVTTTLQVAAPHRFRQFWRVPVLRGDTGAIALLATLELEEEDTYHVTSAADGRPVAIVFRQQSAAPSGGGPPQAEFWDLTTGKRLPSLPTPVARTDPRISRDGQAILSIKSPEFWGFLAGADGAVRWWQTATGLPVGEPWRPRRPAQYATLTNDGQLLVTRGQDHLVRLFEVGRGYQCGGDVLTTPDPRREFVPRVGVSPDGSQVATAALDGTVRLWNTRGFLPQDTIASSPRGPAPDSLRPPFETGLLSPDGRMGVVASARPGVGRVVTVSGKPEAATLRQVHLYHCAFSPDGSTIATAPFNHSFGGKAAVTLWDTTGRPRGLPLFAHRYIHSLAFSPDGRALAVGCVGGIFLWDMPMARLRHFLRERTVAAQLTFSPDGTRLAASYISGWAGAGAGLRLWDVNTGATVGEFLAGNHPDRLRPYFAVAFAEGGQTLRVLDLVTGALHARNARTGAAPHDPVPLLPADEAVFSASGAALATAHANGSVQQWDTATGRRAAGVLELSHPVTRLAYSPDGRVLATACRDRSVRLWHAPASSPLGPPLLHQVDVLDLRFTPDGASVVTLTAAGHARAWPVPEPVADDPERFEWWLRARGGTGLENDYIVLLDAETWRLGRDRLQQRWPEPDPALVRPPGEADWHDARARDAEEVGSTLAALWHLDRLITLRPRDWHPLARKGLLYATAGEFDRAESAYRLAAASAPAAALQDWHRQNAATCLVRGEWSTALRHLDWLVAAGGEDWQVHADRATAYGHLGRHREHDAARARAIDVGADAAFLVPLAEEKAAQGQWSLAAALFARAADRGGLDLLDACHHALCCLKAGDKDGYRRICASLTQDLRTGGPMSAVSLKGDIANVLTLLRVCLLRADAIPDWQPLLKVSEGVLAVLMRESSSAPKNQLANAPLDWLTARGAVLCREGRYADAITSLGQCVNQKPNPLQYVARIFLAFSHLRLGQEGEARRWMHGVHAAEADAQFSWEALEIELLRPMVTALQKEIGASKK